MISFKTAGHIYVVSCTDFAVKSTLSTTSYLYVGHEVIPLKFKNQTEHTLVIVSYNGTNQLFFDGVYKWTTTNGGVSIFDAFSDYYWQAAIYPNY